MNSATAARLLELNRQFYEERGADFSETRQRVQPGTTRLLGTLRGDETILDLGCGNGELARALSRQGHQGAYLGLDMSEPLLSEAERGAYAFSVQFARADFASQGWDRVMASRTADSAAAQALFDVILCLAVLHHIPSHEMRTSILCKAHDWLGPDGHFMLSNWRFTDSPRMRARIQPWASIGVAAQDVDANDYLMDWRRGGRSLRYVHEFDAAELTELAATSGFTIIDTFYSDGVDRKSGLYQIWKKNPGRDSKGSWKAACRLPSPAK